MTKKGKGCCRGWVEGPQGGLCITEW
jgi:hypothetical protein